MSTASKPRQWRVCWTHRVSGDRFVGDAWDRETADWIAANVITGPWATDVRVRARTDA